MCGIAGIILQTPDTAAQVNLKKMTDVLRHRGPDGEGHWSNAEHTVHLGHRRLSVIDLSDRAAQPMNFLNRYQIVYNGEIYNYPEIRSFLQNKGYRFSTKSDTEVILAAYDYWKEKCLQQFDGMFAFTIWDEKTEKLFAARDRFGEKPLYYYEDPGNFIFASEMKALWAIGLEKKTDSKMLLNYITLGHVQNCSEKGHTFFEDIYSLPPGHYLTYEPKKNQASSMTRYWSLNKEMKIDIQAPDAIEKFTELFTQSVKRRMRSDVALGTSLSGGLDSASIAYTINHLKKEKGSDKDNLLQTFSAVFPSFENDESKYIESVSASLHITNHQTQPTATQLIQDFETLCYHQEEPFSSSGIFAQYKVFELAKKYDVKVLLDGQGADEILAGYPRYIHWFLQEVLSRNKPRTAQIEIKAFRKNNQNFRWDIKNIMAAFLPSHAALHLEKLEYRKTISHPDISHDFLNCAKQREWVGIHKPIVTKLNDMLHFNITKMGLEELLRFADRNSMAHGREVRLPFLSHELVEFVFSLPSQLKMHDGWTKFLLRQTMNKKLPDEIVWRKEKIGFEPPQKKWMNDPMVQEYIHEAKKKLANAGILTNQAINKKIHPLPAYADKNYDWRYLCAAQFI